MISIIYFTKFGEIISKKLNDNLDNIVIYDKSNYKENMEYIFKNSDVIVFISATGIAVRIIAPHIQSKFNDPAVIVIDDEGRYVISLLSGHVGGANEMALKLAKILNATPIITTSTDIHNIEAIDVFAKKNKLYIENKELIKTISQAMLSGEEIDIVTDISVKPSYKHISSSANLAIYITYKIVKEERKHLVLRPRVLNVGIGIRRGVNAETILNVLNEVFEKNNLSINSIKAIASYELKKDEVGLFELKKILNKPLIFFSKDEINEIECEKDEFVYKSVGVYAVSEPCARLLGGKMLVKKYRKDGVTISVCLEE